MTMTTIRSRSWKRTRPPKTRRPSRVKTVTMVAPPEWAMVRNRTPAATPSGCHRLRPTGEQADHRGHRKSCGRIAEVGAVVEDPAPRAVVNELLGVGDLVDADLGDRDHVDGGCEDHREAEFPQKVGDRIGAIELDDGKAHDVAGDVVHPLDQRDAGVHRPQHGCKHQDEKKGDRRDPAKVLEGRPEIQHENGERRDEHQTLARIEQR